MTTFSKICTIYSAVHEKPDEADIIEGGFYELEVRCSLSEAAASGDAKGFIQKEVAKHLAVCVKDSGIPLGEDMWRIEFTNFIAINFNFPNGIVVA